MTAITKITPASIDETGNYTVNTLAATGNVTASNANLGNAVTANFFIGNGSFLTGLPAGYANSNVANYLPTHTGNISANYFIGNGASLTSITGANVTGQVGNSLVTGTVYTNAQPNITSVGTLSSLTVSGNITSGNANLGNAVNANFFIGNGASLTSIAGANVTGFVPNANVANTAYSVSGANITGEVSNALVAGTVYTNAQPNITSVGTLTGLTVSGNATITGNLTISGNTITANVTTVNVSDPIVEQGGNLNGALTTNDGKDRGAILHYYTTSPVDAFIGWDNSNAEFALGSNVTISSEVVSFNTFGNLRAGTYFGDGSQLTGVTAISAQTVTGNIQNNITSVGTLTSLSVTGNVTAGNVYANSGTIGANSLTGVLTTASQPNITNLGSLLGLTVTGNVSLSGANVNLGAVSNLKIAGGTANYVLKTDGAGNLSWVQQPSAANITIDNFSGNGAQTIFTLSTTPSNANSIIVNINGLTQLKEAYSVSGANLTFVSAPPNNTKIEVTTLGLTSGGGGGGGSLATLSDVSLASPTTNQVLRYNGSTWINSTISAYIYSAISANTTLSPGYRYLVDTSAANLTLTLPATPTLGQEVGIIDATGSAATHAITVNGNGANIMGNSSSLNVSTNNAAFSLVYYNAARGWILTNV